MDKLYSIQMIKDMEVPAMDEEIVYTVEREFLGRITVEQLLERIIQMHRQQNLLS